MCTEYRDVDAAVCLRDDADARLGMLRLVLGLVLGLVRAGAEWFFLAGRGDVCSDAAHAAAEGNVLFGSQTWLLRAPSLRKRCMRSRFR